MKNRAKRMVTAILAWQLRRLRARHQFQVIAVAGSVGKTSTKFAIARVLEQGMRIRWQEGNYNTTISVPLVFFGHTMPSLFNPFAWAWIFITNEWEIASSYPFQAVVIELGVDYPGDLAEFGKIIHADLGVLTAISPEHMEFFGTIENVAKEETELANICQELLVNTDLCPPDLRKFIDKPYMTYATKQAADYQLKIQKHTTEGFDFEIQHGGTKLLSAKHESLAEMQLYSVCAAVAAGYLMGLDREKILKGIEKIKPVSGRMQWLNGIKNSTIIDDTYNSSPDAVIAALDTLYRLDAPQKIAILGNMNELGDFSREAHEAAGKYCDPRQLDFVITIGDDANKYLAPAAAKNGCKTRACLTPYEAAEYIEPLIKSGALILAKGSQNRVYAEEAVKALLANPADAKKLVRQSSGWLKAKQKAFTP